MSADFRSELQSVKYSLFFLIDLILGLDLFHLHGKVGAQDFENLLVRLVEADMLVLALNDARLALDDKDDLVVFEDHRVCQVSLVLDTVADIV